MSLKRNSATRTDMKEYRKAVKKHGVLLPAGQVSLRKSSLHIPYLKDVTQQTHYTQFRIQPLEFIGRNKLGFLEGNIIKYVCRYDLKNGLEDLKKARHYLDCLIEREEKGTITL